MELAKAARSKEISRFKKYYSLSGFMMGFLVFSDPLLSLPIILVPILSGQPLEAATIFYAMSLMSLLSFYGLHMTTKSITSLANYISVLQRI